MHLCKLTTLIITTIHFIYGISKAVKPSYLLKMKITGIRFEK